MKVMQYRNERDTMGEVKVPEGAYYGAQTQRSIENFNIAADRDRMPKEIIHPLGGLTKCEAFSILESGFVSH